MIKDLIARGIGFTPGGVNYIVTHGLDIGEAVVNYPAEVCVTGAYVNELAVTGQYVAQLDVTGIYPEC